LGAATTFQSGSHHHQCLRLTTAYLPQAADLIGVAVTWLTAIILMLAGAMVVGRRMPPEIQIGIGWGALCIVLTVWGVLVPFSLVVPATVFVSLALCVLALRDRRPSLSTWKTFGRIVPVTLVFWLVIAPMQPSQPDTWLNLLPNAFYLVDWGRLPTAALPPSYSYLPAAPYNTQFVSYLGSFGSPNYPAAGMSLINAVFLLAVGLLIARTLAMPLLTPDAVLPWGAIAGGMLLVTLLNPGFVPRFHLSAYGETALAATAAMSGWLLVSAQSEIAAGRHPEGALVGIGLVLAAMVNAKQSGIGLVAASAGAAVLTSWAEGGRQRRTMLRLVALALISPLALYTLWRYHVSIAGVHELKPLPFAQWNWAKAPEILASAGRVVAGKVVYLSCAAAALIAWPLLLRRQGWTLTTRLLAYHACLLALYNGFLLLTYIGLFSGEMSIQAHSFFRYNTHLALVLVLALALAARDLGIGQWLVEKRARVVGSLALAAAVLAPLGYAYRLRFDLDMPQPLVRSLATNLKAYLTDGDRLALLLPGDNNSVATMIAGVLTDTPPRRRGLDLLPRNTADPATLDEAARLGYRLALISCVPEGWEELPPSQAVLLRHGPDGWRPLAEWPYPPHAAERQWKAILSSGPLCRRS
jgi:hypothetical protein